MKRQWLAICVAVAMVLVLSGLMWRLTATAEGEAEEAGHDHSEHAGEAEGEHEGEEAGPAIEGLQTMRVELASVSETITLTGEVQHDADRSAQVGSREWADRLPEGACGGCGPGGPDPRGDREP